MNANELTITHISVDPIGDPVSVLRATVQIVLNKCLVLNGLMIKKGKFGHYLAFPKQNPSSPFTYYSTQSRSFKKQLQEDVLIAYTKTLLSSSMYA